MGVARAGGASRREQFGRGSPPVSVASRPPLPVTVNNGNVCEIFSFSYYGYD